MLQANPEFKGIKTSPRAWLWKRAPLQANPEFKGIKTSIICFSLIELYLLQANPEFKGIKTEIFWGGMDAIHGFKPTLNSKGLRHLKVSAVAVKPVLQANPEFKGIKTNDAGAALLILLLQANPEFKGIKTFFCHFFLQQKRLQANPEFKGIKTGAAPMGRMPEGQASSQP